LTIGFGQAGTEPAARGLAGEIAYRRRGPADVVALIGNLLHALLGEAVADELPAAVARCFGNRLVSPDRRTIDRQHRTDAQMVEHLEHTPEPDPIAVFVPSPVRDVGHR